MRNTDFKKEGAADCSGEGRGGEGSGVSSTKDDIGITYFVRVNNNEPYFY